MWRIAVITAGQSPIPATRGGATETMFTHLIQENEKKQKLQITIFGPYDAEAKELASSYRMTKWRYYHGNRQLDKLCGLPSRILRKITGGKTYICTNFIRWCNKRIEATQFDFVLVEGNYFQILQLRRDLSLPIVLHMHIDGLHCNTDNGKNILTACKGVIAISRYCQNRIAEIDLSQQDKVHVLKNTVDVMHFCSETRMESRKQIREQYGISEEQKVFIYCGRLEDNKGVKELIQAFISIANPDTFLFVIGSSAYRDGKKTKYVSELEKLAVPYAENIIFTGYISQAELPDYYAASDISVVPSKWEAAGNVIIEAMGCGIPVIASRVGGIPEYADESACVLVEYDENFTENLKTAMLELLNDEVLYALKKQNTRSISLQYNKEHYYDNFCDVVDEIMK